MLRYMNYSIASNPLRRITFNNASAGPLGCRVPQVSILRPGKPPMLRYMNYSIASNPLRRITFNNASAGPLGCLVPRSNCEM